MRESNYKTDADGLSNQADTLVVVSRSEIAIPNTHYEHEYDPLQERATPLMKTAHVPEHCPGTEMSLRLACCLRNI